MYLFIGNKLLLFSKGALNWSEVTVNTFIMLQKISISITQLGTNPKPNLNLCCYLNIRLKKTVSTLKKYVL